MIASNNILHSQIFNAWNTKKKNPYSKYPFSIQPKFTPTSAPATSALTTSCLAAFVVTANNTKWLYKGCLNLSKVFKGEYWRLITFPFLHANIWHLTSNMAFLAAHGPAFEKLWGASGVAKVVIIATAANILAQATLASHKESLVGLSGVLYGIEGALAAKNAKEGHTFKIISRAVFCLTLEAAVCIALKQMNIAHISYLAHTSGFVAGFAFGWSAKPKK